MELRLGSGFVCRDLMSRQTRSPFCSFRHEMKTKCSARCIFRTERLGLENKLKSISGTFCGIILTSINYFCGSC